MRSWPTARTSPAVPVSPGSGEDLHGAGPITERTWVFGSRVIPLSTEDDDDVNSDRTRWQAFAHLRLEPNLIVGIDGTPLDEDIGVGLDAGIAGDTGEFVGQFFLRGRDLTCHVPCFITDDQSFIEHTDIGIA